MIEDFNPQGLHVFLILFLPFLAALAVALFGQVLRSVFNFDSKKSKKALIVFTVATFVSVFCVTFLVSFWSPAEDAVKTAKGDINPVEEPTTTPVEEPTTTPQQPTTTPPETTTPPPPPPPVEPSPTPPSDPERFELVVDTPSLMKAGGDRVGTNRFQLEDYADEGLLVQVAPAWTAFNADGTEFREQSCSIVVEVKGPEDFGPWYSKRCTKSDVWNGNGDPADGGTSEISLPGAYTVTLIDENTGVSASLDFEVIE